MVFYKKERNIGDLKMSKNWTDEEKLKEFGTTDDKEIMEILNHIGESEKENQKLADEAYDEMVRQGLIKEEDYGYYEDEDGNEEYDENLKELDTLNNNAIKKVKENEKVKEKLYKKDDIKEGFDITTFDYNFKNIYGDIIERDFKIYHFLKHHFSYGRTKLVRDMFSQEERCIKNFMEIEEIVYKRPDGLDSNLTEGYYIPFTKSIKSYGDTFDIIKSYKTKLIKLISEYDTNRINHDVLMFKSDFQLIHDSKMKEPVFELYEKLKFTGKTNYLETLAKILVKDDKNKDLIRAVEVVFYQWIWRIKYKMRTYLNIEASYKGDYSGFKPIVPILYGGQGTGKSVLIKKLTQPFEEAGLKGSPSTSSLFESYTYDILSKNFILVLDDFQQIDRNKVPVFKEMISGETRTGRQKGDQSSKNFKSLGSFILASNESSSEMIADDTGNRRLFEIEVKHIYEAIKDRNFIALWKSVDENSPPINAKEFEDIVEPFQAKHKKLTPQERFVQDYNLVAKQYKDIPESERKNYRQVNIQILLAIYNHQSNGFKINSSSSGYKKLLECLGVQTERIIIEGKKDSVIYLEKTYSSIFAKLLDKFEK